MYSNKKTVEAGSILFFKDAFWYYNAVTLRAGVNRIFANRFYYGLTADLNYYFFNNIRFNRFEDNEGEFVDVDYVISRTKYQYGGVFKLGHISLFGDHWIIEKYIGLGLSYSHELESISAMYEYRGALISAKYPIESTKNHFVPTVHFGISLGLRN